MNPPKRKDPEKDDNCTVKEAIAYNQACHDWEEFLNYTFSTMDIIELYSKFNKG